MVEHQSRGGEENDKEQVKIVVRCVAVCVERLAGSGPTAADGMLDLQIDIVSGHVSLVHSPATLARAAMKEVFITECNDIRFFEESTAEELSMSRASVDDDLVMWQPILYSLADLDGHFQTHTPL